MTNAANHALSIVFAGLLQPGDEVVMPSPCYQYNGILENDVVVEAANRIREAAVRIGDGTEQNVRPLAESGLIGPTDRLL